MLRASFDACVAIRIADLQRFVRRLLQLLVVLSVLGSPSSASAAKGDCAQPVTTGERPTATDALFILRAAVASASCDPLCICDVNASDSISATDALVCLRYALEIPEAELACHCTSPTTRPCTSVLIRALAGSHIDTGWTGYAHDQPLIEGAEVTFAIVGRCADSPEAACSTDEDCPSGACEPSCDCDDPSDSSCNVAGPTGPGNCTRDLQVCETNADCGGAECRRTFGPPLPLIAANVPACVTTFFIEDLAGTVDVATGDSDASALLRSRVHLGIAGDRPCPRCGASSQNPVVGQQFTCSGGPRNGSPCTVEAVSPLFGGVSSNCPPDATTNVSGAGLSIPLRRITTGTTHRTAGLPCVLSDACVDDGSACQTNADCTRCTDDLTACTTNADCGNGARCAAAPEQPVSCGAYCHCGFCDDDPTRPCFGDEECEPGEACTAGGSASGIQDLPNACADIVCGRSDAERCCAQGDDACPQPTPLQGTCETKGFVSCSGDPNDARFGECERQNAGECMLERQRCFDHVITRTGAPSPIGRYCLDDGAVGACGSNADCAVGTCVADSAEPSVVGLFCIPRTASSAVNAAGGIPGPGALILSTAVLYCRCGDGEVGCDEECDDGNAAVGDGCDAKCRNE